MKIKELRELLTAYPDDMEVVVFRPSCEDYEEFYDPDFCTEVNDDNQLVLD